MLPFIDLLFEERFEIRVVLSCHIGSIEKEGTESGIASFGDEAFAFDGGATLMDSAIESDVGNEFVGGIKAFDGADVSDESSGADGTDTGDGLEEGLGVGLSGFELFLNLFEGLFQGRTECGEGALEFFFGGLLIDVLDTDHVLAFGFDLREGGVFAEESFEFEDFRSIGELVAMTSDEDVSDGSGILGISFDRAKRSFDRLGGDIGVDDSNVPLVVCEEDTEEKMVYAGGLQTNLCEVLLEVSMV